LVSVAHTSSAWPQFRIALGEIESAEDSAARQGREHRRRGPIQQQHGLVKARRREGAA
jgi:hypothetical protein